MRRDGLELPKPTPGWPEVWLCLFFYALVVLALPMLLPADFRLPWLTPLTSLGGLLVYAGLARAFGAGDPRVWRDRSRFGEVVRRWAVDHDRPAPDEAEVERLRARSWRETSATAAQQAGLFAGVGAGVAMLGYSEPLAVLVFGAAMLVVGHLVKEWLMAPDRAEFGHRLESD